MESILNAVKCAICHEILESPVILPCSCNICNKHVSNQNMNLIRCEICGVEHHIPANGFHPNKPLQMIIKTEIAKLDLGSVHKSAKKSCEYVEDSLKELKLLIKDPYFYTHGKISELKNIVQLKGEEIKLRIDQEMKKLIDRLEEYERQSKEYLSSNEFKEESKKLESELKIAQSNLDSWIENLNKIKIDEEKWKNIKEESDQNLKCIIEEIDKFKNKLLLNKFDENQNHVKCFKNIKIDSLFLFKYVNRNFLVSRIIDESLAKQLDELLKKKDLNGQNWSLLYQGSRDGFEASDFHSRCDYSTNTLTIVKSTNGNIFGGFTSAQWSSPVVQTTQFDKNAFIFSLVNKENRPLIFEHTLAGNTSIYLNANFGPVFGGGHDFVIHNSSNTHTKNYSNLGFTYIHPEYLNRSEKAKKILAGSNYFQVQDIEVFQIQQ